MQNTTNLFGSRGAADLSLSTPMLLPSLLIRSPAKGASCLVSHCARPTRGVCDRALREVHGAKNNERHARGRRRDGEPAVSFRSPTSRFPFQLYRFLTLHQGMAGLPFNCAHRTSTVSSCAFCEQRAAGRSRYPYIMSLQARLFVFSQEGRCCCSQLRPSNETLPRARVPLLMLLPITKRSYTREESGRPFNARIERALLHRARSASKKDGLAVPSLPLASPSFPLVKCRLPANPLAF